MDPDAGGIGPLGQDLRALEVALRSIGRSRALEALRPGLPPDRVALALRSVALPPDPSIETLYGWRDGTEIPPTEPMDDYQVYPGFWLLPLDVAVDEVRARADEPSWDRGWFPVLADGGGDFFVVDLSAAGVVRRFRSYEVDEHPVEYVSLGRFVSTLSEGIRSGAVLVDARGYLEFDGCRYERLAESMNPGVEWWRS